VSEILSGERQTVYVDQRAVALLSAILGADPDGNDGDE
jgi:hypothetical protein